MVQLSLTKVLITGSNFVALKSPNSVGSSVTFTLPSSDGSNGHVLQTDGSGNNYLLVILQQTLLSLLIVVQTTHSIQVKH